MKKGENYITEALCDFCNHKGKTEKIELDRPKKIYRACVDEEGCKKRMMEKLEKARAGYE